jgi:hypothetical protein
MTKLASAQIPQPLEIDDSLAQALADRDEQTGGL